MEDWWKKGADLVMKEGNAQAETLQLVCLIE